MGKIIMNKKTLILLAISLVGTQAWAGSVTVPNTFVDGATASASEVNANFDAVKTAVNDNDSRITTNTTDINTNAANITDNTNAISAAVPQAVLKDANGVYVGRVIGMPHVSRSFVLTDKGYRTQILIPFGKLLLSHTIVFETTDCTGPAYIIGRGGFVGSVFLPTTNFELAYTQGDALFYTPKDAQGVSVAHKSSLDADLNCQADVLTEDGWPAFPNEFSITGVTNTAYPAFMQIE